MTGKHYYISPNGALSGLRAMERKLAEVADDFAGWVMSEDALNRLVARLEVRQSQLQKENRRLLPVDIKFSHDFSVSPAFLSIGQHYIICHPVKGWDMEDEV